MRDYHVAIVGATGLVGQEFIRILQQRHFPLASLRLLASDRSAGRKIVVNQQRIEVEETLPDSFQGVDIALFSAGAETSRYFSPIAAQAGTVVVDNSSAFRMMPNVPLVVPEVNPEDIKRHRGIIANPNCSTIQMVVALYPLHKVNPIKRIVVDTYQSVSGTGAAAVEESAVHVAVRLGEVTSHCLDDRAVHLGPARPVEEGERPAALGLLQCRELGPQSGDGDIIQWHSMLLTNHK